MQSSWLKENKVVVVCVCDYYGSNCDDDFHKNLQRIIIESNSQLVTNQIRGKISRPKEIISN